MNRRSNKLNGVVYYLKSEIRTGQFLFKIKKNVYFRNFRKKMRTLILAVEMKFDKFQDMFISMDPYHTGFITAEEFSDILKDTCDELVDADAEEICKAYDTNHDDRVNYIEFLKPFADRRRIIRGDDDQVLKSVSKIFDFSKFMNFREQLRLEKKATF